MTINATKSQPDGVVETCIVNTSTRLSFFAGPQIIWALEHGNAETK